MSFNFQCPFCEQNLLCLNENENTVIQCPNCGNDIVPQRNIEPVPEFVHVVEIPKEDPKTEVKAPVSGKGKEKAEPEQYQKENSTQKEKSVEEIYTQKDGSFKNPLLADIFKYISVAYATFAVIFLVLLVFCMAAEKTKTVYVYSGSFAVSFVIFLGLYSVSLGISHLITCICKTTWDMDKAVSILEKLEKHLSEKETRK